MPHVPAFCDTCGTAFPSGIVAENSYNITFQGGTSGPCPKCGGTGHILEGVFNFVGSTIEVLKSSNRTKQDLLRLKALIKQAKAENDPVPAVNSIKEEFPEFSGLLSSLPHNRNELYTFLSLLIALLTYLHSCKPKQEPSPTVINNFFNSYYSAAQTAPPPPQQRATKVGRNEMCPCGSGKKFKKCHGSGS